MQSCTCAMTSICWRVHAGAAIYIIHCSAAAGQRRCSNALHAGRVAAAACTLTERCRGQERPHPHAARGACCRPPRRAGAHILTCTPALCFLSL